MYRVTLGMACLMIAALANLPTEAWAQQKNPKAVPAADQDYYLIRNVKGLAGQLLDFDDGKKTASIRFDFPEWVPNPKYRPNTGAQNQLRNDYNRLAQEQQRMTGARNPRQLQQYYRNIMNLQNRIMQDMTRANTVNPNNPPFIEVHHTKDFELTLQDTVVYRKTVLPLEYDDTGNVKKYSKKELADLKGKDTKRPGYSANADEFHPGYYVGVYFTPPSKKTPKTSSSSSATVVKDDGEEKTETPERPTVRMLVITQTENTVPIGPTTTPTKTKKK